MKQNLVLKYFTEICKIPHTSGNEQALAAYVTQLLKKNKCRVKTDKLGNVYAYKEGTLKTPGICFQAHLDMVGEKILDSNHNFKTDPIDFYEDHGWIKAKGTTLGADNGAGLAIILALFTDQTVAHGPIEAVFTVQEETTTIGANKLPNDWIKSPYLINVDSEKDDVITIGSGWCCDFNAYFPTQRKTRDTDTTDLSVKIMNGTGGHSGSTIHLNTVNTIVEFFNILKIVSGKYQLRIIDIKSTTQLNAIPPYCDVTISIKRNQVNHFKKLFLTQFNNLVNAYKSTEKNLTLVITNVKSTKEPLTINDTNKLINLILSANNGLNNYDSTFNIPSVSTNLGKVILNDSEAQVGWLQRSNNEYNLNKLNNKLSSLFELVNGSGKAVNLTEGLNTNVNNRLALQVQKIAQNALNHPTILLPTHAVLEIGDIARHYPEITCISIGPDIQYAHTPKECVEINSMLYIYQLLKEILKSIR